jgi:hypothetical protein
MSTASAATFPSSTGTAEGLAGARGHRRVPVLPPGRELRSIADTLAEGYRLGLQEEAKDQFTRRTVVSVGLPLGAEALFPHIAAASPGGAACPRRPGSPPPGQQTGQLRPPLQVRPVHGRGHVDGRWRCAGRFWRKWLLSAGAVFRGGQGGPFR